LIYNYPIVQAETGSGKTLAYLIPIIQQLVAEVQLTRDEGTHGTLRFNQLKSSFSIDTIIIYYSLNGTAPEM